VDLRAAKAAPVQVLARGSVAAARNARSLVEDASVLAGAGRTGRACSLAVLAVEEVGKAYALATLAALPENLRAQAPVGRMLEWHQLKLVAGQMAAVVPFSPPVVGINLVAAPLSDFADELDVAEAFARDEDRLKQRGLYVDVDQSGLVREPSEVTAAQVRDQLDRAERAASAVSPLLDPGAAIIVADPWTIAVEFSRALVSAMSEVGHARTPEAAADVLMNTAIKIQG
jgi:AbiV family abortive infection protein